MCGIVASIGKPLDRQAAFDLTTSLLIKTHIRGEDASGFWAADTLPEAEGAVYWTKAPVKSADFVKRELWQELKNVDTNLLIAHCRKSTRGNENRNRNNHPFLSEDYRTALVHNGNVPEYDVLRRGYDVQSECDSEILLRMMEVGPRYPMDYMRKQIGELQSDENKLIKDCTDDEMPQWSQKLLGLIDIFARVNYGAMAVAVGEKLEDGSRYLWLFRDKDRPLFVVDMRATLGQIYVCSDKKIWRDAVEATPSAKKYVKGDTPIIEFPVNCIWLLKLSPNGKFHCRKFKINRFRSNMTFESERPALTSDQPLREVPKVFTDLNHDCEVGRGGVQQINPQMTTPTTPAESSNPANPSISNVNQNQRSTPSATSSQSTTTTAAATAGAANQTSKWPLETFEFMCKYIFAYTVPNVHTHYPATEGHLRSTAYDHANNIPNPCNTRVVLSISDYQNWARSLREKYKWTDRKSIQSSGVLSLWTALKEARDKWIDYIDHGEVPKPLKNDEDDDDENLYKVHAGPVNQPLTEAEAINVANTHLAIAGNRPIYEDDEEEDDGDGTVIVKGDDEIPLGFSNSNHKGNNMLEASQVDEYNHELDRIRRLLSQIETRIAAAIKANAINKREMKDTVNCLKDTADTLEGQQHVLSALKIAE